MTTREHPILFSDNMVRAIRAKLKNQTRRPAGCRRNCAPIPTWLWKRLVFGDALVPAGAPRTFADDGYLHVATRPHQDDSQDGPNWTLERVYPKWKVGDRLRMKDGTLLEVTKVRVEKLQDILAYDAFDEGCPREVLDNEGGWPANRFGWFAKVWDENYAKRGFGWSTDPWVFAYTIKVIGGVA